MQKKGNSPDLLILLTVMILLCIGIIMVFSSSQYVAFYEYGDAYHFLRKQLTNAALGLVAMVVMMRIDHKILKDLAMPALIGSFILLLLLFAGFGHAAKGAVRWLDFGPLRFQPSEIMKLSLVLYLAVFLSERQRLMGSFRRGFLPPIGMMAAACLLILKQPDLGTALTIVGTTFVMLWAAGTKISHLATVGAAAVGLVVVAIISAPYRMERVLSYLDPWQDALGDGFQAVQSQLAIGSGGLIGVGLSASKAKEFYLPERHTDFIFAIICEETGFIGGMVIIALFLFLIWRGLKVAQSCPDVFSSLLAVGITAMVGFQAILNLGVVTGALPVTGVTLPLISYGGSSLIFTLAGIGLLLNVSRRAGTGR